jgi:single-stranded-DNA-specific exonuclease
MRWIAKSSEPFQAEILAAGLRSAALLGSSDPALTSTIARLLVERGVVDLESAERFLAPSLSHLHSPYLMRGMKLAVDRIEAAIERRESILIYGDYDVDGTTAIVILKKVIELCGGSSDFHVPHRIREGYDLREDVVERAAAEGTRLIISVDTGIRAFAAAETAKRLGVDLIVTDHHLPGPGGLPPALSVLNPNQPGCDYPCKAICGAGVAFKLAQALIERRLPDQNQSRLLTSFAKVAAIATVADAVPLTGENRVFAKIGLEALQRAVNPGLKALLEVAGLGGRPLTAGEVGFRLAPRINAAGRMDVACDVIELFSVKESARAAEIARKLDRLNTERQEEEGRILQAIHSRFEQDPALAEAFCIVIDGEGWHRGVIGITATRVVERYRRPTLVISRDGEQAHGSGRSIRAFHLLDALESCSELFTRFGGHSHAVGFSLPTSRLPALRAYLGAYARERLTLADFEPILDIDTELPLEQITQALYQAVESLGPFGVGNPQPVFAAREVSMVSPVRVMKAKHVKLRLAATAAESAAEGLAAVGAAGAVPLSLTDSPGLGRGHGGRPKPICYDALGWRMAERWQQDNLGPGAALDIAFTLDYNQHPEFGGLELSLRDYKPHTASREAASRVPVEAGCS